MPNEIFTWYWFFSVIIAGLLVNLVSVYLKTPIDGVLSKLSSRWKRRVERKMEQHALIVERYVNDQMLLTILVEERSRMEARACFFLVLSVLAIILSNIEEVRAISAIHILASMVFAIGGFFNLLLSTNTGKIVRDVKFCRILAAEEKESDSQET